MLGELQNLKRFISDNTGASPVVGVILVVGLAIIIAAVLGGAVFGISDGVGESPPQGQFVVEGELIELDQDDGATRTFEAVVLRYTDGQSIDPENLEVTIDGDRAYTYGDGDVDGILANGNREVIPAWFLTDQITAGDETEIVMATDIITNRDDRTTIPVGSDRIIYYDLSESENVFFSRDGNDDPEIQHTEDEGMLLEDGQTLRVIWEAGDESHELYQTEINVEA